MTIIKPRNTAHERIYSAVDVSDPSFVIAVLYKLAPEYRNSGLEELANSITQTAILMENEFLRSSRS